MKYKKLLYSTAALVFISACASTPRVESEKSRIEAAPVLTHVRPEFQVGVTWEPALEVKTAKCSLPVSKEKTEWKKLVSLAASCVSEKSWAKVEHLASQLMEQESEAAWGPYFMSLVAESKNLKPRALWMVDLAIKRAPTTAAFYYQKARVLWSMKIHRDAVLAINKALEVEPTLIEGHTFLGQIYYQDHDFSKAQVHLEKASSLGVRKPGIHAMLGEIYLATGNHLAAVGAYEKAVSDDPKKVEFRLRQAYVYDELLQNKSEALARYMAIQDLITKGTFAGKISFNLSDKINNLKKLTAQNRAPADSPSVGGGRK